MNSATIITYQKNINDKLYQGKEYISFFNVSILFLQFTWANVCGYVKCLNLWILLKYNDA